MIRSGNPIKSYRSLHISHWPVGVLTAPTSFFTQLLFPRTKFDLQTKTFKMTPRTKLSHEFEMTEEKCTGTFLHYQATKLFIVTSATKGSGYHSIPPPPARFGIRFKILYRVIQVL